MGIKGDEATTGAPNAASAQENERNNSNMHLLNDDNGPIVGHSIDRGTIQYKASDDILMGQAYKMYDNPQHLVGVQEQYNPRAGSRKIVNFKQDYIILIRKKLFYAANAANQQSSGKLGESSTNALENGNYMRTYLIDTFTSCSTNHSILSPGSCSFSLKGGERVMCYEDGDYIETGIQDIDKAINKLNGTKGIMDQYENPYDETMQMTTTNGKTTGKVIKKYTDEKTGYTMRIGAYVDDDLGKKAGLESNNLIGVDRSLKTTGGNIQSEHSNQDVFKEGLVTVENRGDAWGNDEPLTMTLPPDYGIDIQGPKLSKAPSTWKFAEKCDWESMDEVWVFGKSNFERDESTGDFKMKQIFFGYISEVKKTHASGATNGLTISITAKDQLKLLDLSYVSTQPTMIAGASMNGAGIDLRWGKLDTEHFGTVEIYNPFEVMAMLGKNGSVENASEEEKRVLQSMWKSFALKDIFGGMPMERLIRQLCMDAGIPTWYLTKRIEPIQFPPITVNIKQGASDQVFTAVTEKRLQVCQRAVGDLQLEFFADEEGNIVLKCPNYALGANTKVDNNMGYSQLKGGLLNSPELKMKNLTNGYWARHEKDLVEDMQDDDDGEDEELKKKGLIKKPGTNADSKADQQKGEVKGKDGVYIKDPDSIQRQVYTEEYKQYLYAKAAEDAAKHAKGDINNAKNQLSGSTITNPIVELYNKGTVNITVREGMTLYELAEKYLGDGNRWPEIFEANKDAFSNANASEQELNKLNGQMVTIYTNANSEDKNGYNQYLHEQTEYWHDRVYGANGTEGVGETTTQYIKVSVPRKKFEKNKHKWYDGTLSELTDELIPEIPQEYIMGFTLTESDENLFNMYEVNITGDFSPFDQSGAMVQIRRVFPDIDSMIRFGCRPSPKVFNFPHMGNKANAHLIAYMMCAKSVAERYSATLNMIEDSSIRIGNPIRFFAYDEHPHKPLASQERGSSVSSALSDISNTHNPTSLQTASNNITKQAMNALQMSGNLDSNFSVNLGSDASQFTEQKINEDYFKEGDDVNISVGQLASSSYKGVGASWMAQHTDAQAIYYVTSIRRDIGVGGKESTMTLTLTCGRMMGEPSCIDQMMLLYKTYYNSNTGYCPDLSVLMAEYNKYHDAGNEQDYVIQAADTFHSIAKDIYGLEIEQPQLKPVEEETEEQQLADKWSTRSLKESGDKPFDSETFEKGWKRRTYESKGEFLKYSNGATGAPEQIGTFTIYVYDNDKTRWVYEGILDSDGKTTTQPEVSDESQSYQDKLSKITDEMHAKLNAGKNGTKESKTSPQGDAYVVKCRANIETKDYYIGSAFMNQTKTNIVQEQLEEFRKAIIALNPEVFGNSLAQNGMQINNQLQSFQGQKIKIPKSIDLTELKKPGKNTEGKTTEAPASGNPKEDPDNKNEKITETDTGVRKEITQVHGTVITQQNEDGSTSQKVISNDGKTTSHSGQVKDNSNDKNNSNILNFRNKQQQSLSNTNNSFVINNTNPLGNLLNRPNYYDISNWKTH